MDKEQPNSDYRIFEVDLQKSIRTILKCSPTEILTPELLDELATTLWLHAEGCKVWWLLQTIDESHEIEIELACGVNGTIWAIQYFGAAQSNAARGRLTICPHVPFLREQWNERVGNPEFEVAAFCEAFKKHVPTIAMLPYDVDLSVADFANHTGLTESQIDFAGKRVVCHWLEENVQINLVAVEVSRDENAKPESPFENCRDWVRAQSPECEWQPTYIHSGRS